MATAVLAGASALGGQAAAAATPDTVAPVIDSVVSADFPPLDSPTPGTTGRPGSFTITAHDDGGGLRRIEWLVRGERSTGTTGNPRFGGGRVLDYAPSATVTVVVTPPERGTNVLVVWATDRGGRTQTVQYLFTAQGDPSPRVSGDVDGDRIPDVVTSDAHGDLRVYPGTASGRLGKPFVASSASGSPAGGSGGGWGEGLLAHRGASLWPADDLWVMSPPGALTIYRNDGIGDFAPDEAVSVSLPSCSCPGNPPDWSGVTSMVLVADPGVDAPTTLVTIQNGRVWQSRVSLGIRLVDVAPVLLPLVDAAHSDLVSPGDVTGDGRADLWVRDRVRGRLTQFARTDAGFDPHPTVLAWSGFDAVSHPVVTSVGDLSGDGVPDLLTTSPLGGLQSRSATALRSPSWISPQPFVAKAVTVEGQLAHP